MAFYGVPGYTCWLELASSAAASAKMMGFVEQIEHGLLQTKIFRDWDKFLAVQFDIPNSLQAEDIARMDSFIMV